MSGGSVGGCGGTVERRNRFSAMGGVGEPRIRRATIYLLSAAVVDAGGGAELCVSVECRAGSFHRHRADDGGALFVCAGAAVSAGERGAHFVGAVPRQYLRTFVWFFSP